MSSDDRKAKLAALKAKAKTARRGGAAASSTPKSNNASRAHVTAKLLAPPTYSERHWYALAKVEKVVDGGGDGVMRMPVEENASLFRVAPLTTEKGDYPIKYEQYKPTDVRKPLTIAEFDVVTLKIKEAPSAMGDWKTPDELFPGQEVTVKNAVLHSVFKGGTHLSGTYDTSNGSHTSLDLEMPRLAFNAVLNDKCMTLRNQMLSMVTPGFVLAWDGVERDDPTKEATLTNLTNTRGALLDKNGPSIAALMAVADAGDDEWKKQLTSYLDTQIKSAPFCTDSLGIKFTYSSEGPTMLLPIAGLGLEDDLNDTLPGDGGTLFNRLFEESGSTNHFEGVVGASDMRVFGGSYKKGEPERASGGPWVEVLVHANAMSPGATDHISVGSFTFKLSLAAMPKWFGSARLQHLELLSKTLLPMTNHVVAFNPDTTLPKEKEASTMDCRIVTADVYTALLQNGLALDWDSTLKHFKGKEAPTEEEPNIKKTLTTKPKPLLACGFQLLNENPNLQEEVATMHTILEQAGRKEKAKLVIRAIHPGGFEAHKQALKAMKELPREERLEHIDDWFVYAVIKLSEPTVESSKKKQKVDK